MNHPNRKFKDIKKVICVGGHDSSAGAGISVDSRAISALGVPYKNIVTAITAQNHERFFHLENVSKDSLIAQLDSSLDTQNIIKIGMLGSSLKILGEKLKDRNDLIILDPVFSSSSGFDLFEKEDINYLKNSFLPKVEIITPNILEAEILWGKKIKDATDVEKAAKYIKSLGVKNILIKGGHLATDGPYCADYFLGPSKSFWIKNHKINRANVRGTGCFLASAWAAGLALGLDTLDSLVMAKIFHHKSFRQSFKDGASYLLNPSSFNEDLNSTDMPWVQDTFEDLKGFPKFILKSHPTLYPIVDRASWLERLSVAGPRLVQLRIKDLTGIDLENEIKKAIKISKEKGIDLFINDFWELAIKYEAFGVHLGQEDLDQADLEKIREAGIRLGISTHCYFEAARAHAFGPSYLAFGPIYHTALKAMDFAPQGLENLKIWCQLFSLPLVAIGGINLERGDAVAHTGVDIISVVRDILLSPAPEDRLRSWKSQIGEQI